MALLIIIPIGSYGLGFLIQSESVLAMMVMVPCIEISISINIIDFVNMSSMFQLKLVPVLSFVSSTSLRIVYCTQLFQIPRNLV
jgi:hypothetical protein